MESNVLFVDNSNDIKLIGFASNETGEYLNQGNVYCNVFDSNGNLKTGEIFPKTMTYLAGTNGNYLTTLSPLLNIVDGEEVIVVVTAVQSQITLTKRVPMLCLNRITDGMH